MKLDLNTLEHVVDVLNKRAQYHQERGEAYGQAIVLEALTDVLVLYAYACVKEYDHNLHEQASIIVNNAILKARQ